MNQVWQGQSVAWQVYGIIFIPPTPGAECGVGSAAQEPRQYNPGHRMGGRQPRSCVKSCRCQGLSRSEAPVIQMQIKAWVRAAI